MKTRRAIVEVSGGLIHDADPVLRVLGGTFAVLDIQHFYAEHRSLYHIIGEPLREVPAGHRSPLVEVVFEAQAGGRVWVKEIKYPDGTVVEVGPPSIAGTMVLADNQCLVALGADGTGHILDMADNLAQTDVLIEPTAEDCGFDSGWDEGLVVGMYLLTVSPWAHDHDGEWDNGISVMECTPLWRVPA